MTVAGADSLNGRRQNNRLGALNHADVRAKIELL